MASYKVTLRFRPTKVDPEHPPKDWDRENKVFYVNSYTPSNALSKAEIEVGSLDGLTDADVELISDFVVAY